MFWEKNENSSVKFFTPPNLKLSRKSGIKYSDSLFNKLVKLRFLSTKLIKTSLNVLLQH